MESSNLKVVIVGGSIAGLTLAHCLLRIGIDFVVLETRGGIHPQEGAALGIMPNGSRILDQLGIFDDLIEGVQPLRKCWFWSGDGELIVENDGPVEFEKRPGYCSAFVDEPIVCIRSNRVPFSTTGGFFKAIFICTNGNCLGGDITSTPNSCPFNESPCMWSFQRYSISRLNLTMGSVFSKQDLFSSYPIKAVKLGRTDTMKL